MYATIDPSAAITSPKPDGSAWEFAIVTHSECAYAGSLTSSIAALIPDYEAMTDDDALFARYTLSVATADGWQAIKAAEFDLDPEVEDEATLTALLTPRGEGPTEWSGTWSHPVPLVLVRTDYAPFTEVVAPEDDILFVDPSHERAFLESMDALGAVSFLVRAPGE